MLAGLYAGAGTLAAPLLRRMLRRRVRIGKEIAARLGERQGFDTTPRPPGRLVWLHAASVGETRSVLPVLAALAHAAPDIVVLMTTGTVTSAALLAEQVPAMGLAARVLHRFVPLDVPAWGARFLDHWHPDAAAFVESEIWPNLLAGCTARGIPVMLVNGRMSARSFARWRLLPGVSRRLFGAFARVHAQSAEDAARLGALGARVDGPSDNLKFAAASLPVSRIELERLRRLLAGRPLWLAACTHPGEDEVVLRAHGVLAARHPGLLTIIVPRHPLRGTDIAALAGDEGRVVRRSLGIDPTAATDIWIADTLGELGLFYRLAGMAFIGGSLVPVGGQNPLEAARLGCVVAIGPHTENQREAVSVLKAAGVLSVVRDAGEMAAWADELLGDSARRRTMGEAGIAASRRFADLPQQIADQLVALMTPTGGA